MRIRAALLVSLAAVAVAVSACAGNSPGAAESSSVARAAEAATEQASAEPAPAGGSESTESSSSPESSASASQGAPLKADLLRGVRLCVVNNRTYGQKPAARLNVKFLKADRTTDPGQTLGPDVVSEGFQKCGEAAQSDAEEDVLGTIALMYIQGDEMTFGGNNASLGGARVSLYKKANGYMCAAAFTVGQTDVYDDGVVRYTVERLADSDKFKEFTVTVTDTQGAKGTCRKPLPNPD